MVPVEVDGRRNGKIAGGEMSLQIRAEVEVELCVLPLLWND